MNVARTHGQNVKQALNRGGRNKRVASLNFSRAGEKHFASEKGITDGRKELSNLAGSLDDNRAKDAADVLATVQTRRFWRHPIDMITDNLGGKDKALKEAFQKGVVAPLSVQVTDETRHHYLVKAEQELQERQEAKEEIQTNKNRKAFPDTPDSKNPNAHQGLISRGLSNLENLGHRVNVRYHRASMGHALTDTISKTLPEDREFLAQTQALVSTQKQEIDLANKQALLQGLSQIPDFDKKSGLADNLDHLMKSHPNEYKALLQMIPHKQDDAKSETSSLLSDSDWEFSLNRAGTTLGDNTLITHIDTVLGENAKEYKRLLQQGPETWDTHDFTFMKAETAKVFQHDDTAPQALKQTYADIRTDIKKTTGITIGDKDDLQLGKWDNFKDKYREKGWLPHNDHNPEAENLRARDAMFKGKRRRAYSATKHQLRSENPTEGELLAAQKGIYNQSNQKLKREAKQNLDQSIHDFGSDTNVHAVFDFQEIERQHLDQLQSTIQGHIKDYKEAKTKDDRQDALAGLEDELKRMKLRQEDNPVVKEFLQNLEANLGERSGIQKENGDTTHLQAQALIKRSHWWKHSAKGEKSWERHSTGKTLLSKVVERTHHNINAAYADPETVGQRLETYEHSGRLSLNDFDKLETAQDALPQYTEKLQDFNNAQDTAYQFKDLRREERKTLLAEKDAHLKTGDITKESRHGVGLVKNHNMFMKFGRSVMPNTFNRQEYLAKKAESTNVAQLALMSHRHAHQNEMQQAVISFADTRSTHLTDTLTQGLQSFSAKKSETTPNEYQQTIAEIEHSLKSHDDPSLTARTLKRLPFKRLEKWAIGDKYDKQVQGRHTNKVSEYEQKKNHELVSKLVSEHGKLNNKTEVEFTDNNYNNVTISHNDLLSSLSDPQQAKTNAQAIARMTWDISTDTTKNSENIQEITSGLKTIHDKDRHEVFSTQYGRVLADEIYANLGQHDRAKATPVLDGLLRNQGFNMELANDIYWKDDKQPQTTHTLAEQHNVSSEQIETARQANAVKDELVRNILKTHRPEVHYTNKSFQIAQIALHGPGARLAEIIEPKLLAVPPGVIHGPLTIAAYPFMIFGAAYGALKRKSVNTTLEGNGAFTKDLDQSQRQSLGTTTDNTQFNVQQHSVMGELAHGNAKDWKDVGKMMKHGMTGTADMLWKYPKALLADRKRPSFGNAGTDLSKWMKEKTKPSTGGEQV